MTATTPIIQSVGSVSGAGTAGQGRNNLVPGETVTLSDTEVANSGAVYFWVFDDVPIGTAPTLADHTTATPSFVPDADASLAGSYRLRCTVNGLFISVIIIAVPLPNTGARIPSFEEETQYNGSGNTKGWHEALTVFMREADASGGGGGAVVFDDAAPADRVNIRSDRGTDQSPIDNTKIRITNLGSQDLTADAAATGATADGATILGGNDNTASGAYSVVVGGVANVASDYSAHAEGESNEASGFASHAEGSGCTASGYAAHAEGTGTIASGIYSHAEGESSESQGTHSHAEGFFTVASGDYSHAEGQNSVADGLYSHAEGSNVQATGDYSHAQGDGAIANAYATHAEGVATIAQGMGAHAEGYETQSNGWGSHSEGRNTAADGDYSHAEGHSTSAPAEAAHSEGADTNASGDYSHAEGSTVQAVGEASHAEGWETQTDGVASHAEGYKAKALRPGQHAHSSGYGGLDTTQIGYSQHSVLTMSGYTPGSGAGETVELMSFDGTAFFELEDDRAYAVVVTAAAVGDIAAAIKMQTFKRSFAVRRQAGLTVIVASGTLEQLGDAAAVSWTFAATVGAAPDRLRFDFTTGATTAQTRITAKVEFTEIRKHF